MNQLANETIELFGLYVDHLKPLSEKLGVEIMHYGTTPASIHKMGKLAEGLTLIKESIVSLKSALDMDDSTHTLGLEPELAVLLKDLVAAIESGDAIAQGEILRDAIPPHLEKWKTVGVQHLIDGGQPKGNA